MTSSASSALISGFFRSWQSTAGEGLRGFFCFSAAPAYWKGVRGSWIVEWCP